MGYCWLKSYVVVRCAIIGTFRSKDKNDYEYKFFVLSARISKIVGAPRRLSSASKRYVHAQYGKLVLVVAGVLRSEGL